MGVPDRIDAFRNGFLSRLVALFALVAAGVALLVGGVYVFSEVREGRRYAESVARLAAVGLAESARLPLFSGNGEELAQLARFTANHPGVLRATVLDSGGRVLTDVRSPGKPVGAPLELAVPVARGTGGSPAEVLAGADPSPASSIGTVRVEYATPRLSAEILRAAEAGALFALLYVLLVSLLSYPLLRRANRAFGELLEGLGAIRDGNYDRVLPVDSGTELGIAAANVNALASALRRRETENRALQSSLENEVRERARAEGRALEGERTLRELMDATPAGMIWTDLGGNIRFINRYTLELFGYGHEEIRTVDDWFARAYPDPEHRRLALEAQDRAIEEARARGSEVCSFETRVACRDGTMRHILFTRLTRKDRVVVTITDLTEREAMQDRLLRAQKMETLGVLAGGIAHNFNNVLTSVLGYISFARKRIEQPQRARELLAKAEEASRAAAGIASQLLTFARGGEPVRKPLSVVRVVEDAVSLSLVGTRVTAALEVESGLHGVDGDEGQLCQAFNNLLLNAVQAMPGGGVVTIRCANARAGESAPISLPPGRYVRVSFSDHGCGIPAGIREKIFEPYFTTRAGIGSGLGLASVRSIVERHGGAVTVESEVDRGTTFTLHLPSTGKRAPADAPGTDPEGPVEPAGEAILFLDDEPSIRSLAQDMLGHFGYRVTTCSRGEEAVELYRSARERGEPFAAAVLDLTIANGMGGREAAERILSIDPEALLVVSSGYSNDPVMSGYADHGFRASVPKPYRGDDLARTLSALIPRREAGR